VHNNFDHAAVALSVGIQHMVRSDLGSAGVMFTLDTDSASATWFSSRPPMASAKLWCKAR